MEKNKQSSVEWLHQEHSKLLIEILSKKISLDQARIDYDALFLKAKNLHEDEITDAYVSGSYDMARKEYNPQKYYDETYGK